jgi:hypothetical protein
MPVEHFLRPSVVFPATGNYSLFVESYYSHTDKSKIALLYGIRIIKFAKHQYYFGDAGTVNFQELAASQECFCDGLKKLIPTITVLVPSIWESGGSQNPH